MSQDGFPMILIARMVTITSLAPLIASVNGVGEYLWPSKHWQNVWIMSFLLLLASIAGFISLSLVYRRLSLVFLAGIMGLGALYVEVGWVISVRKTPKTTEPDSLCTMKGVYVNGPIAALLLLASYSFLGATDATCGPPGHEKCYRDCFLGQGGIHYLVWMCATRTWGSVGQMGWIGRWDGLMF